MTRIVWDENKRRATFILRGLDFAIITPEFFFSARVERARGGRLFALGYIDDHLYAVIFSRLGSEALSIVSLRRASRKERQSL